MAWNSKAYADPEAKVEKHLRDRVADLGGICWKFTSPGTVGVPDRIVILNGLLVFVELKRPKGGRVSDIQQWRVKQLIQAGQAAYVLSNTEMVDELIAAMMRGGLPDGVQTTQLSADSD